MKIIIALAALATILSVLLPPDQARVLLAVACGTWVVSAVTLSACRRVQKREAERREAAISALTWVLTDQLLNPSNDRCSVSSYTDR